MTFTWTGREDSFVKAHADTKTSGRTETSDGANVGKYDHGDSGNAWKSLLKSMALISWWLSEQIAFQQTKLFCHKQFGRIYIFTATKMDAFEKAFWHPIILGSWEVANNVKHSLDQPIVRCFVLNILHWRNLQIPRQERKKVQKRENIFHI